jgi:hypothetical protein
MDTTVLPDFDFTVLRLRVDVQEDPIRLQTPVYPAQSVHDAL